MHMVWSMMYDFFKVTEILLKRKEQLIEGNHRSYIIYYTFFSLHL